MIIGLDFDNTIACYDQVFYSAAQTMGLIPENVGKTKQAVCTYFRDTDQEDTWTELQGLVYGDKMHETSPYPGVPEALRWMNDKDHEVYIISHKTRYPYVGPKFDLHGAARNWIETTLIDSAGPLISQARVHFLETKVEKISKITELDCDLYIDDLPEILCDPGFPDTTRRVLFDPGKSHHNENDNRGISYCASSWHDIRAFIQSPDLLI